MERNDWNPLMKTEHPVQADLKMISDTVRGYLLSKRDNIRNFRERQTGRRRYPNLLIEENCWKTPNGSTNPKSNSDFSTCLEDLPRKC